MAKPSDFVNVQLSAAGAKVGPVRVANAHFNYFFEQGKTVRVLTSEWRRVLSQERRGADALLEIAPAPVAPEAPKQAQDAPAMPAPMKGK